jgi:outer membrane protein assembly factor BamA
MNNKTAYTKIGADARTYLSVDILHEVTLALRLHGEKIFGAYPFFESAFLGGSHNLLGYVSERFAGDASLLGSAELRIGIGVFSILMPCIWGVSLFDDNGRVYASGETSKLWHNSFGGGIWLAPLGRANTISLVLGRSTETLRVYFSTGFTF